MTWLGRQFNENHLFRRLVICFFGFMYFYVTWETFKFTYFAVVMGMSASDLVLVIGTLQSLMTLLMGYTFKIYSNSRNNT